MTVWVDFTFEDPTVDAVTFDTTGLHRSHGLCVGGKRPVKAEIYLLGSEELSAVEIKKLEEYIYKFVAKVLHPMKREILVDKSVYSLSADIAYAAGYFKGRQLQKRFSNGQI